MKDKNISAHVLGHGGGGLWISKFSAWLRYPGLSNPATSI